MKTLLNITGAPDSNRLYVSGNNGNMNSLQISIMGSNSLERLVDPARYAVKTITLGGTKPILPDIARPDLALNAICDPDTNQKSLQLAAELIDRLGCPVVNHPDAIFGTTRDAIYDRLHDIEGLRVPKTVTVAPTRLAEIPELVAARGISYPYIFRSTGEHGGHGMLLVRSGEDLEKLERFAFDGRSFYVTAFVDFRSEDGLYRKIRMVVIDGEVYPRHSIVSDSWNIHAGSREELMAREPRYQEEERAFHTDPPALLTELGKKIYERLSLDFFGIDCTLTPENEMLIFEVNACMRVLAENPSGYHVAPTERIKTAFNQMVQRKIEAGSGS